MHQGHNIPWNIISTNFKFVKDDRRYTPPFTGVISKRNGRTASEVKHFVHRFIDAIRTFSETERSKYPAQFTPLISGPLFSDELRDRHPEFLNHSNQCIEYWIRLANGFPNHYTTSHGDLADVVKVLLYENQMETLLMLAQHPSVPLRDLHNLSWGHHFGFSRVKEAAIRSYLFFNCAEAIGILENGEYASSMDYNSLLSEIGSSMDFDAQQIPHWEFLRECGVLAEASTWNYQSGKETAKKNFVHQDYSRLREYLKTLFALMYRYDLLVRECGLDPAWEAELARLQPLCQHTKWDYANGDYFLAYV